MKSDSTGWANVDREAELFTSMVAARTGQFEAVRSQLMAMLQVEPGARIIDVGCGIGDEVRQVAERIGPAGRVVGLDLSVTMIEEARNRSRGQTLPVEFVIGDAAHLDFRDESFDRSEANLLLMHVEEPARVLAEMVRITRRGGLVLISENDLGTATFNSSEPALTRRVLDFVCDSLRHGWIGRQLPGLFNDAGLQDVAVVPFTIVCREFDFWESINGPMQRLLDKGVAEQAFSEQEAGRWLADLKALDGAGKFFSSVTAFAVRGRRP